MKLTSKGRYAVMALVDLARFDNINPVSLRDISLRQGISLDYLEQIFSKLRKKEIVQSVRGTQGGYVLNKKAKEIKLTNIFDAVDEKVKTVQCKKESKKGCNGKSTKCLTHNLWDELENHINNFFEKKSLEDLIKITLREEFKMDTREKDIEKLKDYKYGFTTDIENIKAPKGLNEDVIKFISNIKKEPQWMLDFRLKAYERLKLLKEPNWQKPKYPKIDYQDLYYYSAPKSMKDKPKSLDELDPKLLETYKKLGIPLQEQARLNGIAVDAVFDSVSVATTFKGELTKHGIIFCSMSEAIQKHPELVKKYLGTVIPVTDHFFATLNSAVFTDGSFVYIPEGVKCPMELSTYFRINASETGQFERTLIIADKGSYVSYLEGCTAPMRDENQLHAANVELIALDDAEIKYSTVQNWYPGDENGKGGIYNFVTKRGLCKGKNSKISWTQVETGSAITWKYPSCILKGDNSIGEFYSIAITNNHQKADTGTKMIHLGKNTKSKIISKGISAGFSDMTYRGLVDINSKAKNSSNYTQCDSLLMGNKCGAHTVPYIKNKNFDSNIAHEATTSKISEEQLHYCQQRGLNPEEAVGLIVNGFCKEVLQQLPMEFAVEAQKLVGISLEGSVG